MDNVVQAPKPAIPADSPLPRPETGLLGALAGSEWTAWICLAVVLLLGLPLFVHMPLWCDVTLYDVAARNLLSGGVHYRDVFDTNMPGIVWIHALVRSCAGWSSEVMRLFDVLVLTAVLLVLVGWLRELGASRAERIWFAACLFLFYFFLPEICHCQRDGWMLLPVLLAVRLRCRRLASGDSSFRATQAILEGCFWGLAIWIKPHVLVPALLVWVASAVWISGGEQSSLRRLVADTLYWILGGVLVGLIGIGWMLASGTWGPFWDVFLRWNPHYWAGLKAELPFRYRATFFYLLPWSLLHLAALPVALANLIRSQFWTTAPQKEAAQDQGIRRSRAILAALYLGWMGQALYLQHAYEYVHVPETILALALLSAQRWPVGLLSLGWFATTAVVFHAAFLLSGGNHWLTKFAQQQPVLAASLFPKGVLYRPDQLRLWPRCWTEAGSAELHDRLASKGGTHPNPTWSELEEVAEYLRTQHIGDGELVCWHDSTHPLYLLLQVKPAIRFMHVGTTLSMQERTDDVRQELEAAGAKRLVVSDLIRVLFSAEKAAQIGPGGPLDLPPALSEKQRHTFPFDQPIVFRSSGGRYLVHRIEKPIERITIPAPFTEDD